MSTVLWKLIILCWCSAKHQLINQSINQLIKILINWWPPPVSVNFTRLTCQQPVFKSWLAFSILASCSCTHEFSLFIHVLTGSESAACSAAVLSRGVVSTYVNNKIISYLELIICIYFYCWTMFSRTSDWLVAMRTCPLLTFTQIRLDGRITGFISCRNMSSHWTPKSSKDMWPL